MARGKGMAASGLVLNGLLAFAGMVGVIAAIVGVIAAFMGS